MCSGVYRGVQALYGAAKALDWKISERQNSTYLALLKCQNIKTSLYKLSKNGWVCAFFKFFDSVREILQSTVLLDHPVSVEYCTIAQTLQRCENTFVRPSLHSVSSSECPKCSKYSKCVGTFISKVNKY